jgi:hypothetical protein
MQDDFFFIFKKTTTYSILLLPKGILKGFNHSPVPILTMREHPNVFETEQIYWHETILNTTLDQIFLEKDKNI